MSAAVVRPGEEPAGLALQQVAPGRYRGAFEVAGPGSFTVSLSGARDAHGAARERRREGLVTFNPRRDYSPVGALAWDGAKASV